MSPGPGYSPAPSGSNSSPIMGTIPDVGDYLNSPWGGVGFTNTVYSLNQMMLMPLPVPQAMTFDRIACFVITTAAGGTLRLGIYNSDANYKPSSLVLDAGTGGEIDGSVAGERFSVINQTLQPGLYYLALAAHSSGAMGIRTYSTFGPPFLYATAAYGVTPQGNRFVRNGVAGALPNPAGVSLASDASPQVPLLALRRSA